MPAEIRIEGKYRHTEGLTYSVWGLAQLLTPDISRDNYSSAGKALSVAGYEETHIVKGDALEVLRDKVDSTLVVIKEGDFECPPQVVVYEQLEKGQQYPQGQLWWRPIDNFLQYFTPTAQ